VVFQACQAVVGEEVGQYLVTMLLLQLHLHLELPEPQQHRKFVISMLKLLSVNAENHKLKSITD